MTGPAKDYSKSQVDKAGKTLVKPSITHEDPKAFEEAMRILSFWRSVHEEPLEKALSFARERAHKVESSAVMAKRLKRAPSIIRKLTRKNKMQLSRMQDIGGCRVIVSTSKKVRKVVRALKKGKAFREVDYLTNPKDDGYRSVHLIGQFHDQRKQLRKIEIQVRSAAQHSWATSVEIIDLFTSQALKANMGKPEWQSFFLAASRQIELIESIPVYNQLPRSRLAQEIYDRVAYDRIAKAKQEAIANLAKLESLERKLRILKKFEGLAYSLQVADEHMAQETSAGYALLKIDTKQYHVDVTVFKKEQFETGSKFYLQAEMDSLETPERVVALVSSDAVGGIREAYPNFFADSTQFVKYMNASIDALRNR